MESPQGFVEEIDTQELSFEEVVGKGAFGVVSRAKWRGKDVAVKLIETETERKAFLTELKQLSRVNHPNIVKLYGACTNPPAVCLVMEYAEGGSLYNVLHGAGPQPAYTAAHAMSWALQCARGVEYLHSMKPKALIHRDLKPPNLLLIMGGTVLKICDFGTACDIQTHMTNNKGSAAWMAPEVFEGSNYSEKCDVFSWGIIIWEIFTRRKPFDEIGGPAFRIMWAVHNGTRPPLIRSFPKPLELLMTRSWSNIPSERPSMAEIVRIMSHLFQFFTGADQFLEYPAYDEDESPEYTFSSPLPTGSHYSGTQSAVSTNNMPVSSGGESRTSTFSETVKHSGDYVPHPPQQRTATPTVVEEDVRGQRSAPPSLAASRESLIGIQSPRSVTPVDHQKRYSADISNLHQDTEVGLGGATSHTPAKVLGHRRSGSYGTPPFMLQQPVSTGPTLIQRKGYGHRRVGSDGYSDIQTGSHGGMMFPGHTGGMQPTSTAPLHHVSTFPGTMSSSREATPTPLTSSLSASRENTPPYRSVSYNPPSETSTKPPSVRSTSWTSELPVMPLSVNVNIGPAAIGPSGIIGMGASSNVSNLLSNPLTNQAMSLVYQSLDHQYQPIAPCPTSSESMEMFHRHCQLAQKYLHIQTEIAMFEQTRHELRKELDDDVMDQQTSTHGLMEEYQQLEKENESLQAFHSNLSKQLEQIRKKQQQTKRYGAT